MIHQKTELSLDPFLGRLGTFFGFRNGQHRASPNRPFTPVLPGSIVEVPGLLCTCRNSRTGPEPQGFRRATIPGTVWGHLIFALTSSQFVRKGTIRKSG